MIADTRSIHGAPRPASRVVAAIAAIGDSVAWAFAMRRECDRWTRSGRRLDGPAIRQISDRLST